MICNNNYLADILRVREIKDLIWVMRFQSPLVYIKVCNIVFLPVLTGILESKSAISYFYVF